MFHGSDVWCHETTRRVNKVPTEGRQRFGIGFLNGAGSTYTLLSMAPASSAVVVQRLYILFIFFLIAARSKAAEGKNIR